MIIFTNRNKEKAELEVSDQLMENARYRFPVNTPQSKEAYMFRAIFADVFQNEEAAKCVPYGPSVACSTAIVFEWDKSLKEVIDPSGRAVKSVHEQSY